MKTTSIIKQIQALLIILLMVASVSCQKDKETIDTPITPHEHGDYISSTLLGTYTPDDILVMINPGNQKFPLDLKYNVEAFSVTYYTTDAYDNLKLASGAIFVPTGISNLPVLSIQHGTECLRDKVASVNPTCSTEGISSLIGASMGYFTITCDYIGFGISDEPHPYMHAASIVPSVIDFIRASKSFAKEEQIDLDGQVFLTGYSEGGYISLATQKEIEENHSEEFILAGVAPMAGPYDFSTMIMDVFASNDYPLSAYFAYSFKSYDEIYGWDRMDYFFKEPYNQTIPDLFNGTKSWDQVINQLPASIDEIFREEFVLDYLLGYEPEVALAVQENTLLDWKPASPIHFIHGDADQLVPLYHALNAIDSFNSNGATHVSLTTIPGGTHATAGPEALITALHWIDSMSKGL